MHGAIDRGVRNGEGILATREGVWGRAVSTPHQKIFRNVCVKIAYLTHSGSETG